MMGRPVLAIFVVALAAACSPSASSPRVSSPTPSGAASDVCAGDPWLAQIIGERPRSSAAMSLDGMRRSRLYGPYFGSRDRVEMDHLGELATVRAQAAEVYEWQGPPITRWSSSDKYERSRVIVLRNAFGDPRAFREQNGADRYASPITLPTGIMEFPPTQANINATFAPTGGSTIFTFGDGTWVKVDGWMAQRFRSAFSSVGNPPPLPPAASIAAWEVCAFFDQDRAMRSGAWATTPQRGVLRFFAGGDVDVEMVFRFAAPDLATRAMSEQRIRCSQPEYASGGDKGIFSLTPPCRGVLSASVDGPMLRYALRVDGVQ
jgi:hypothetical protein